MAYGECHLFFSVMHRVPAAALFTVNLTEGWRSGPDTGRGAVSLNGQVTEYAARFLVVATGENSE
jgi:hypothetical protein